MEWLKRKRGLKIVIIISIFIVLLIIGILVNNNIKNKKIADGIEFKFSSDYEYFNISVNDFYKKISYELRDNNIKTKELKSINYDDEYDLFYTPYCEWNYAIDLNNGDRILLCSDNKGKTISSIGYDFTKNIEDGEDAGFFIGRVSKLFHSSDFNSKEFENDVLNGFFSKEEIYDFSSSENGRYAYNHILYGIDTMEGADADGNIDEGSKFIFAIMSPITEITNKEWKENTEKQWEEWKKEYEQQQAEEEEEEAEIKRKAEEEAKKQAEEAEKIKSKERIFTAGTYEVGVDIPAGKYNMIAISGRDACVIKNKVYEIFSSNPDEYSIDRYNNVKLELGDEIRVDGKLKIKFEAIE